MAKTICAKNYGINPDLSEDLTVKFNIMLNENRDDTTFVLEKGTYHFYEQNSLKADYSLSNSENNGKKNIAVMFRDMKNTIFDGSGSSFIYHGQMMPFSIENCTNITLKNFIIDWHYPTSAEAEILAVTAEYLDLYIDYEKYPYNIENGKLIFSAEGFSYECFSYVEFDKSTKCVTANSPDCNFDYYERLSDNKIRCYGQISQNSMVGNIVIIRHGIREHSGIFADSCNNLFFENIKVHCTCGLGILTQFCENVYFDRIDFLSSESRKILCSHDDGIHCSNNRGMVEIVNCSFAGLMDDCINIHGTAAQIIQKVDDYSLIGRFVHSQSNGFLKWAKTGDLVSFINNKNMNSYTETAVKEYKLLNKTDFYISFVSPLSHYLMNGHSLENITNTASLICKKNVFGNGRARGILFSTRKKVVIENNIFTSSGSAILIAGDANYWFETGECNDVLINENIFNDSCLSSHYQFCNAIISICPEIPEPETNSTYHKNIKITNNLFNTPEYPVLFALSVDKISFNGNKIFRSYARKPCHTSVTGFTFEYCKNIDVSGNTFIGNVLGKNYILKECENIFIDGIKGDTVDR